MAFRLPSIEDIVRSAAETYFRFPLTLICAMLFSVSALFLIEAHDPVLGRLIMTAALGLPLFFAVEQYIGLNAPSPALRWGLLSSGLLLMTVYCLLAPPNMAQAPELHAIRFAALVIGFILLATYLPVLHSSDGYLFWNYNKRLFLRIVTTIPFTVILYAGLAIGLAAVQNLFAVQVNPHWYFRIWVLVAGLFNTWFFLSGIPRSLQEVSADTDYPKPLRLFTVNVLLPLVLVYVIILYLYSAKILIEGEWPKGWVGYLVLGFSGAGIFSLLLAWPLKQDGTSRWVRGFSRSFYLALMPLCILLLLAIWRRIDEYGLTENRYYVILSGLWLFGIAVFYTVRPSGNIRLIPVSISLIALLTAYGSWSPFAISKAYQLNRLEHLLQRNQLSVSAAGKGRAEFRSIPFEDNKEISNILSYVLTHFGPEPLEPLFPAGSVQSTGNQERPPLELYTAALHIPAIHFWQKDPVLRTIVYIANDNEPVDIAGYALLLRQVELTTKDSVSVKSSAEGSVRWELSDSAVTAEIRWGMQTAMTHRFDLSDYLRRSPNDVTQNEISSVVLPQPELTLSTDTGGLRLKLVIAELRISADRPSLIGIRFRPLLDR